MRKHGDIHTLNPVGNRLQTQYAFAILQIMGIAYMRKWLHDIHGIILGEDPESFLERTQMQGVENRQKRSQQQCIKNGKNCNNKLCGFEGWCENVAQRYSRCKGNCFMHTIDDSSSKPLAQLQSERYIEVCDLEVLLYNEQRDESIVFRNIKAIREWCRTHKFGHRSNEKGIIWHGNTEKDLKDAGPNGILVERKQGLSPGYDGKWIWTLTGRLTRTSTSSRSSVLIFDRDQNGNYQYLETIYDY